ncbi:MAG: hypothetical protein HYT40_03895 [Candidatus Sungbacteria bacterium]|uniref:Uncharacterized protein n=1 Tax=Candidatus Sungiibacteriota bacterium TaxID=2750080 RepID=A0A931WNF3_9BACT|nr:hypothetical protein [Candidatus Sungbacteria bacterium]
MQKLKGRLLYMGWFNLPWKLVTDDGEIDLWPIIDGFLTYLNGKRASHKEARDGYTLAADEASELQFKYVPGKYVLLKKPEGFGASNVHAYLDSTLVWLSGRLVEIEIEDGKQIKFTADASEKVFGVYFVGNGDSCEVPNGIEETVCKIGKRDYCIFLSWSPSGFQCEKFSGPTARELLDRLAKGTTRAGRIGNCALLGRKEREAAAV